MLNKIHAVNSANKQSATKATRMKALMPTLREKKRYVAFKIMSENKILNFDAVSNAISESGKRLYGEIGMAEVGLIPVKERWNPEKQLGLVRVSHKHVNHIKAAFALITKIDNHKAIVSSIGTSGIMKKAVERYMAG
ncbi:TPA: hypothetical protein HA246_05540 [Candidatus Woesearchaeota archaeon]|nr:hypothetical protein [Candidatus Woesearchaeota archaeon]